MKMVVDGDAPLSSPERLGLALALGIFLASERASTEAKGCGRVFVISQKGCIVFIPWARNMGLRHAYPRFMLRRILRTPKVTV